MLCPERHCKAKLAQKFLSWITFCSFPVQTPCWDWFSLVDGGSEIAWKLSTGACTCSCRNGQRTGTEGAGRLPSPALPGGSQGVSERPATNSTLQDKAGKIAQIPQVTTLKGLYRPESKALAVPHPVPNAVLGVSTPRFLLYCLLPAP